MKKKKINGGKAKNTALCPQCGEQAPAINQHTTAGYEFYRHKCNCGNVFVTKKQTKD
jgi:hypothetical protein